MLDQTLDGAANSLSAAERMHAACSLVSRTIATLGGWRAPASVVALLQPAKDVTDVFSRRSMKNGCVGEVIRARQGKRVHGTAVDRFFERGYDDTNWLFTECNTCVLRVGALAQFPSVPAAGVEGL